MKTPLQAVKTGACALGIVACLAVHAMAQLTPVSTNYTTVSLVPKLSITNVPGTTVEVQYLDTLGAWSNLTSFIVGSTDYYLDLTAPSSGDRTYQVVVLSEGVGGPTPTNLVAIPAGTFQMGNPTATATFAHAVTLGAFHMDANLVTLGHWQQVYDAPTSSGYEFDNVGTGKGANYPVQYINWFDAVKWCNARSQMEGLTPCYYTDGSQTVVYKTGRINLTNGCVNFSANGYRLPTEAEFEYAAHGGGATLFPLGSKISETQANYLGNPTSFAYDQGPAGYNSIGRGGTTMGGAFAANGYGLNDMAGNLREWCWDWYSSVYYQETAGSTNPHGPAVPTGPTGFRIDRGGGFDSYAPILLCAYRAYAMPSTGQAEIGFRCVVGQ